MAYESRLELARILLADFDPAVVAIAAQPFHLSGRDAGRSRSHVPDLLLQDASGLVTVVDVKPEQRVGRPEVQAVFRWTEELVTTHGWAFEVWSEADPVALENVRFPDGYRRPGTIEQRLLPQLMEASEQDGTVEGLELALRSHAPVSVARPGRSLAPAPSALDHPGRSPPPPAAVQSSADHRRNPDLSASGFRRWHTFLAWIRATSSPLAGNKAVAALAAVRRRSTSVATAQ